MFITSAEYESKITGLLDRSKDVKIAVAFWGRDSEKLLTTSKTSKFRVICNLESGGTNPAPIRKLTKQANVEIRTLASLHAKVVLGQGEAIVGSANFSTNGLNHEADEDPGWTEAGLVTAAPADLKAIDNWFENNWAKSRQIKELDLKHAQDLWNLRRQTRTNISGNKGLLNGPIAELKDKPVYLAFYKDKASPEAKNAFTEIVNSGKNQEDAAFTPNGLDYFEDADNYPLNSSIISIYYGPRGAIRIEGPYWRIPELDATFKNKSGTTHTLQIVVKQPKVLGIIFDSITRSQLQKHIQSNKESILERAEANEWLMPLYEVLRDDA